MSMANAGGFAGGAAKGMQAGQQMDYNSQYNPLQLQHLDLQNQKLKEGMAGGQGYTNPNDTIGGAGVDDVSQFMKRYNYGGMVPGLRDPGMSAPLTGNSSTGFPLGSPDNQSMPPSGGGVTPWKTAGPAPYPSGYPGASWAPGGLNQSNWLTGDPYNTPGNYYGVGGF